MTDHITAEARARYAEEDQRAAESRAATERRYAKTFPGWRRVGTTTPARCPRVVAGKRCVRFYQNSRCICEEFQGGRGILDHTRMWRTPQGLVITSEPYQVDEEEMARYTAASTAIGLEVIRGDYSPYFPGHTFLIITRRAKP